MTVPFPGGINTSTTLVHSNTTNGSTTFTDSSGNGKSIIVGGSIAHSTDRAKINASSIKCTGEADYLRIGNVYSPASLIDFHIYFASWPGSSVKIVRGYNASDECFLQVNSDGTVSFQWFYAPADKPELNISGALSLGAWNHIALLSYIKLNSMSVECPDGLPGTINLYDLENQLCINGTVVSADGQTLQSTCGNYPFEQHKTPSSFTIGHAACYIDEIRSQSSDIIDGNFTPFSVQYPITSYYTAGTVKKGGSPIGREVCVYDAVTHKLIGETESDSLTGVYRVDNLPATAFVNGAYNVCLKTDDELYNLISPFYTPKVSE